jgi:hypothetical protein
MPEAEDIPVAITETRVGQRWYARIIEGRPMLPPRITTNLTLLPLTQQLRMVGNLTVEAGKLMVAVENTASQ